MPFVCQIHQVAYDHPRQMSGHWLAFHRGEPRPPKEEWWSDTLPPGVVLKGPAGSSARSTPRPDRAATETPPEMVEVEDGSEAPAPVIAGPKPPHSVYREAPSATGILDNILKRFPGLPSPVHNEIMDWAEQRGTPLAPMEVAHLLEQMAGVPRGAANIIPQKYAFALDKAAREGNAEVRMLLTNWGTAGGAPGGAGAAGPWPVPWPSGSAPYGPPQPYGNWQGTGMGMGPWGAMPWGPGGHGAQARDPEPVEDPRLAQLEAQMAELRQANLTLQDELRRKEEQAREERHRQELEAMERRGAEQLAALQASIQELRMAMVNPERSAHLAGMEAKLDQLRDEKHAAQLSALEGRIEELKNRPPPVTGSTEMDVIRETAGGVVDALKSAGSDVKTVAMAQMAKQNLTPGRRSPDERAKLGGSLVRGLERQDAAMADAEELFRVGS